jgi:hypothetical protein
LTPCPLNPSSQLTPQNIEELAAARSALRKINRAISVARFDGWTIGIFAALTFLGSIGDWAVMAGAIVLGVFAWVELRGAAQLRKIDPAAPKMLGRNQLALGSLLALYAIWQLVAELLGHGLSASNASDIASMIGDDPSARALIHQCVIALYLGVLAAAVLGMGGLALYYFSRIKYVESYIRQTPAWIVDLQKAGVTI